MKDNEVQILKVDGHEIQWTVAALLSGLSIIGCFFSENGLPVIVDRGSVYWAKIQKEYERQTKAEESARLAREAVLDIMARVEANHFRTVDDTGAAPQAMTIWNLLRAEVGLPSLTRADFPEWDAAQKRYVMPEGSSLLKALAAVAAEQKRSGK